MSDKVFPRLPRGLVQKQNRRIFDDGPCDGNALLLTAGKRDALFTNLVERGRARVCRWTCLHKGLNARVYVTNLRIIALFERHDKVVDVCRLCCRNHVLLRGTAFAVENIFANAVTKQIQSWSKENVDYNRGQLFVARAGVLC